MTQGKHTSESWVARPDTGFVRTLDGKPVAAAYGDREDAGHDETMAARAHLISAAPEMLKALKIAAKNYKTYDRFAVDIEAMTAIETAIAKAEGRS